MLAILPIILATASESATGAPPKDAVQRAVDKHVVSGARVGIAARRLSDGTEFFSHKGRELFEMASNAKLFTTAAALRLLTPAYEFRTTVIANGKVDGGKLQGNLVIVGGGDPNLSGRLYNGETMAVPKAIAAAIRQAGINEVTGDLVMDDRLFDRVYHAPGWPEKERLWWYAAPISALSFNDNCIDIMIKGAANVGAPASVSVAPDLPCARVVVQCVTVGKQRREGVTFARREDGAAVVGGRIRAGRTRTENITVPDPPIYLAAAIRSALQAEGVAIGGKDRLVLQDEKASPEAREIFVWTSTLVEAVGVANRRSQNFHAEQILKTLGAERSGHGTFESGIEAIETFLKAAGYPDDAVQMTDGSGLSAGNLATPQAIVALLEMMYHSDLREVFFNSLAASGDAGTTLRYRMKTKELRGRIRAKTGTIRTRGIKALSGYAMAWDGEVYAFSILTNGSRASHADKARALEDAVCAALVGTRPN